MKLNTLSDTDLEREIISAKLISRIVVPKDYINLKLKISEIKILDTSEVMPLPYTKLVQLMDKSNLLKEKEVESFYFGKNLQLFADLELLMDAANILIPMFDALVVNTFNEAANQIHDQLPGEGYTGMGMAVDSIAPKSMAMANYDELHTELRKLVAQINDIQNLFGTGVQKLSDKHKSLVWNQDYMFYIHNLQTHLDDYTDDPIVAMIVSKAIDCIGTLNPVTSQDPYSTDLMDNLLEVLQNPKDYYKDCKTGKIINEVIGKFFSHVYPGFCDKYASMYYDEYEDMTYVQQLNFRKCFGISEDNSQLVSFVTQNINVITNPGNAVQGV